MTPNPLPRYAYHLVPQSSSLSKELACSKAGPLLLKPTPRHPVRLCTWNAFPDSVGRLLGRNPRDFLVLQLHARRVLLQTEVDWERLGPKRKSPISDDVNTECGALVMTLRDGHIQLGDLKALKIVRMPERRSSLPGQIIGVTDWSLGEDDGGWRELRIDTQTTKDGMRRYRFIPRNVQREKGGSRKASRGLGWIGCDWMLDGFAACLSGSG